MRGPSLAFQGAVADVLAVLHAVEADLIDRLIGAGARHLHRVAERSDAEDTAAVGDDGLAFLAGTGVEHAAIVAWLRQAVDLVALARLIRIAVRGEHHAERRAAVPFGLGAIERAGDHVLDQAE